MDEFILGVAVGLLILYALPSTRERLREKLYHHELKRSVSRWQRGVTIPKEYRDLKVEDYFTRLCPLPEHADQVHRARKLLELYYGDFHFRFDQLVHRELKKELPPLDAVGELLLQFLIDSIPIALSSLIARFARSDSTLPTLKPIIDRLQHLAIKAEWEPEYEVPGALALVLLDRYGLLDESQSLKLASIIAGEVMRPTTLSLWLEFTHTEAQAA